jgi:protein-L-isoaspartate O-methyltransferase
MACLLSSAARIATSVERAAPGGDGPFDPAGLRANLPKMQEFGGCAPSGAGASPSIAAGRLQLGHCDTRGSLQSCVLRVLTCLALLAGAVLSAAQPSLAPYVPTPPDVVDRMLTLARVGPDDMVYDLGCGDGRIVLAAAQKFGARGVGVDIDESLIARARAAARTAGVEDRVTFRVQDAMTIDVSEATVVTLYLLSASNVRLRPILTRQLRPGARIVAHNFPMGDWEPQVVDNFRDAAGTERTLYLWRTDG